MMTRLFVLFGRFVGLAIAILGIGIFASTVAVDAELAEWQPVVLTLSTVGAVSGIVFLASLSDPSPLRSRAVRVVSWVGMLALAVLPFSFWMYTLPFVLMAAPTLFMDLDQAGLPSGNQHISPDPGR